MLMSELAGFPDLNSQTINLLNSIVGGSLHSVDDIHMGKTALSWAIEKKNAALALWLIENVLVAQCNRKNSVNDAQMQRYSTGLPKHFNESILLDYMAQAVIYDQVDVMRALNDKGYSFTYDGGLPCANEFGQYTLKANDFTLLHIAAICGSVKALVVLRNKGIIASLYQYRPYDSYWRPQVYPYDGAARKEQYHAMQVLRALKLAQASERYGKPLSLAYKKYFPTPTPAQIDALKTILIYGGYEDLHLIANSTNNEVFDQIKREACLILLRNILKNVEISDLAYAEEGSSNCIQEIIDNLPSPDITNVAQHQENLEKAIKIIEVFSLQEEYSAELIQLQKSLANLLVTELNLKALSKVIEGQEAKHPEHCLILAQSKTEDLGASNREQKIKDILNLLKFVDNQNNTEVIKEILVKLLPNLGEENQEELNTINSFDLIKLINEQLAVIKENFEEEKNISTKTQLKRQIEYLQLLPDHLRLSPSILNKALNLDFIKDKIGDSNTLLVIDSLARSFPDEINSPVVGSTIMLNELKEDDLTALEKELFDLGYRQKIQTLTQEGANLVVISEQLSKKEFRLYLRSLPAKDLFDAFFHFKQGKVVLDPTEILPNVEPGISLVYQQYKDAIDHNLVIYKIHVLLMKMRRNDNKIRTCVDLWQTVVNGLMDGNFKVKEMVPKPSRFGLSGVKFSQARILENLHLLITMAETNPNLFQWRWTEHQALLTNSLNCSGTLQVIRDQFIPRNTAAVSALTYSADAGEL